ncbi:hypothetical protein PsYK624_161460 [Phanerochaete sordida]|uniref:Uncharacterized protein n=1 Tax=Phanerochaete sordida TaxID=48140 RepID=A0A9P3GQE6_9APHY|nr:hypothetical protein PsYK624_161460 [Phanerochaete sordida]
MADSEATSHCLDQSADRKTQGPAVLRLVSVESCSGGEHSYHFASNRVPILVIMDCVVCDKGKYHVLLYINA